MRKLFFIGLASLLTLASCKEDVDTSARYVFTESTIVSYLENHQDTYSEYIELTKKVPMSRVSATTVYQLLAARGNYTCFVPTNDAIHEYLESLVESGLIEEPTWDAFKAFPDSSKLDSIRTVIVKNSIIDGKDEVTQRYELALFPTTSNGEFPLANLNDNKLSVYWPENTVDEYYINGDCEIDQKNRDIRTLNGIIFQLHKVIAPDEITAKRYFQDILEKQTEGILTFARAIQACGLMDTLNAVRDEVYEDLYQRGLIHDFEDFMTKGFTDQKATQTDDACMPEHRKYGFTIFPETDEFWKEQGLDPKDPDLLKKLTQWIVDNKQYSTIENLKADENYTSEDNMLYQWVTYHILPFRVAANKLVYHENERGYSRSNPYKYTIPVYEYYATMGKRRLIKLYESSLSDGVRINRFPKLNDGRFDNGYESSCDPDKEGPLVMRDHELAVVNDVVNAAIYPIDRPLAYNDEVRDNLGKDRIRFDGMSLLPEAMTNEVRRKDSTEPRFQFAYINPNSTYQYFKNFSINDDATFIYFNGYLYGWILYRNDEMKALGNYDLMFTLPPVPKRGTYELRYKVLATGARGIMQVYFGDDPNNLPITGIPIDIRKELDQWESGYEADTGDPDYDAEVDKRMRNNKVMKGINGIQGDGHLSEREDKRIQRRIITRQTLDPDKTYYIRMKSILDSKSNEFFMDYMEFCPKEVYDNPETPENTW